MKMARFIQIFIRAISSIMYIKLVGSDVVVVGWEIMKYMFKLMSGTEYINKEDSSQFARSVNNYTIIRNIAKYT